MEFIIFELITKTLKNNNVCFFLALWYALWFSNFIFISLFTCTDFTLFKNFLRKYFYNIRQAYIFAKSVMGIRVKVLYVRIFAVRKFQTSEVGTLSCVFPHNDDDQLVSS